MYMLRTYWRYFRLFQIPVLTMADPLKLLHEYAVGRRTMREIKNVCFFLLM